MRMILAVVVAVPIFQHLHLIGDTQLRIALVKRLFQFELSWSTDVKGYCTLMNFSSMHRKDWADFIRTVAVTYLHCVVLVQCCEATKLVPGI